MSKFYVPEGVANDPEVVRQAQEQFQQMLERSATDMEFRQQLLTDPKAAIEAHYGKEIPDSLNLSFVENTADATIVLPDAVDPEADCGEDECPEFPLAYETFRTIPQLTGSVDVLVTSCSSAEVSWDDTTVTDNSPPEEIAYRVLLRTAGSPSDDGDFVLDITEGADKPKAHVDRAQLESLAENLRLTYVALTRAQHRCTVVWGPLADRQWQSSGLGYLLFGDRPELWVGIGASVIIASGWFIVWRESRTDVSVKNPILGHRNLRPDVGPTHRPRPEDSVN